MSPQAAERSLNVADGSLNAARVVLKMFPHEEPLGFYTCLLSEAASPDGGVCL